jgi:hypothetical protein
MAAGAIPPPLFFERRRHFDRDIASKHREQNGSGLGIPQRHFEKTSSVDHVLEQRPTRYPCDFRIERPLPKDI